MFDSPTENKPRPIAEVQIMNDNQDRWKRLILAMPEIRTEKVRKVRDALRQYSYEDETVLNKTVDLIGEELRVLCRSGF